MALGDWVVTRPRLTTPMLPQIARVEGSGVVSIFGIVPSVMSAEQALDLGHRLVEAGIGAEGRIYLQEHETRRGRRSAVSGH